MELVTAACKVCYYNVYNNNNLNSNIIQRKYKNVSVGRHQFSHWCSKFKAQAKKSNKKGGSNEVDPLIKPTLVDELSLDNDDFEDQQLFFDDEESADFNEDDDWEDEYVEEDETELYAGDGAGGGGISLAGTWWDREALRIAEEVCSSFDGELGLYAFKTLSSSVVQVRVERMTNKSGSLTMEDIEAFSTTYRARLDQAELDKKIPDNIALEVSSPGVERVVRVPEELDRFKERAMYVKYINTDETTELVTETDGIFRLVSFDMETQCCTWGLADVRANREKAGKGRPLSKKQREWRLNTPFASLRLVRLYSEL